MSTDVTPMHPFSQRQLRIIDMLARGLQQKEIADLLNINFSSFRRHLLIIRSEVFALSNEHLIAICFRQGWIR